MVQKKRVIIIGCGFAGLGCAKKLVEHDNVHITLIDKNNYHQFQPQKVESSKRVLLSMLSCASAHFNLFSGYMSFHAVVEVSQTIFSFAGPHLALSDSSRLALRSLGLPWYIT
jgi:flavin-dependent dehydrogenase